MGIYSFCLPSIKIKSNWFDGKDNVFKRMGKEESLNLYLQLFRFRIHQGNYNQHLFRTSLSELRMFTNMNKSKRLSLYNIKKILLMMKDAGVIKIHTSNIENLSSNEMLIVEATDVPKFKRYNNEDTPITEQDMYIYINFNTINYIYDVLGLTSKDISLYALFSKYGLGKGEKKITMKINKIRDTLGTSNEKVTDMIISFNQCGLAYTRIIKDGYKTKFEHYLCKNIDNINKFKRESKKDRQEFLKRYDIK